MKNTNDITDIKEIAGLKEIKEFVEDIKTKSYTQLNIMNDFLYELSLSVRTLIDQVENLERLVESCEHEDFNIKKYSQTIEKKE